MAKTVEAWASPIAESLGLYVWDAEFKKEGADWFLRVYIDSNERGISTDDCEAVSRALEEILDREDPIEQAYFLEISSPGIERVLSRPGHFMKYIGHDVSVKLYSPINGRKAFTGTLLSYDDGTVTVRAGDEEISFDVSKAAQIKLDIIF
ncbi:MAG: ribosome maturation factor RimP [Clostridia bacterium]|nr:ribosome maturation factor RimP [Clostridia bacterium]